jgi:hypothetical protein
MFARTIFAALAAVLALSSAQAEPAGQIGFDRPGGTYVSLPSESAGACAAQCAADGLCLAWTFRPANKSCALKAVVTPAQPLDGVSSGLAPRAPGFAALVGAKVEQEPLPQRVAALAPPPAPLANLRVHLPAPVEPKPVAAKPAPIHNDEELLGGPDAP